MASYPHIERYREELAGLIEFGGSDHEQSIRAAFQNCLAANRLNHRDKLRLIPELPVGSIIPDGTVKDALRMARGYWEARDTHDDLDAEIQAKLNRGYPRDNIVFEDSETAVLFQNGAQAMRAEMSRPGNLRARLGGRSHHMGRGLVAVAAAAGQFGIRSPHPNRGTVKIRPCEGGASFRAGEAPTKRLSPNKRRRD